MPLSPENSAKAAAAPRPLPAVLPPPPKAGFHGSIEQMVRDAHARQASDIHIRVGELPRFRIRGQMLQPRDQQKVTPELFQQYLLRS
jgi:twitching motility protein PilT